MFKRFCILLLAVLALPLGAQTSGRQLREFGAEADAFNRNDPFANVFRAGHYNGYLAGVLDALQGRSVCFTACRCELEKLVASHQASHPETLDGPVATWLVPLLETAYPCR